MAAGVLVAAGILLPRACASAPACSSAGPRRLRRGHSSPEAAAPQAKWAAIADEEEVELSPATDELRARAGSGEQPSAAEHSHAAAPGRLMVALYLWAQCS